MLSVEVWGTCRRHDYCQAELADYAVYSSFKDAYHVCNRELKKNVEELCRDRHGKVICSVVDELYYLRVNTLPIAYRTYLSTQNKQALFLSEALHSKNPDVLKFIDVEKIKLRLYHFRKLNAEYMSLKHRNAKWIIYSDSRNDNLPYIRFQDCEEYEGSLMAKIIE